MGNLNLRLVDESSVSSSTALGSPRPQLVGQDARWLAVVRDVDRHREFGRPLLIAGEASTGKTSLAMGFPYQNHVAGVTVINAAERYVVGRMKWLQQLADRLRDSGPVVVRRVESLDQSCLDALTVLIDQQAGHSPIMLTTTTDTAAEAESMAARLRVHSVRAPSLRERAGDVSLLWRNFSSSLVPDAELGLARSALELLQSHLWPGNLRELSGVVEQIATSGKRGMVAPSDLPQHLRSARPLSMIQRAELEAIRSALVEADGNRSRAAEILGLSRATIYRKMRAYKVTQPPPPRRLAAVQGD